MKTNFSLEQWRFDVKHLFESNSGYQAYMQQDRVYEGRLIPMCTPVQQRPPALVVGTNHSDFIAGGGEESHAIARNFSLGNSSQLNTLNIGTHRFAKNLRMLGARSGHPVNHKWVGTNRCPIQTGSKGITDFFRSYWFQNIQRQMDDLLYQLIGELKPDNLILCGNYAAELGFGSGAKMKSLSPRKIIVGYRRQRSGMLDHFEVNVIPIQHPSRMVYSDARVISESWVS